MSGDNQRGEEDETLRNPIVVRVVDASGNPVAGAEVAWVTGHGGRFTPAVSTTDANGLASTQWRLGDKDGRQWAQAVVAGVVPRTFGAVAQDD